MNKKVSKVINTFLSTTLIVLLLTSCSNNSSLSKSTAVKPNYIFTLEDAVKKFEPAIIDAAKQAIFNYGTTNQVHASNIYIDIFEVKEISKNTWEVRYKAKDKESDSSYNPNYWFVTVEKKNSGTYQGYLVNPGGTKINHS